MESKPPALFRVLVRVVEWCLHEGFVFVGAEMSEKICILIKPSYEYYSGFRRTKRTGSYWLVYFLDQHGLGVGESLPNRKLYKRTQNSFQMTSDEESLSNSICQSIQVQTGLDTTRDRLSFRLVCLSLFFFSFCFPILPFRHNNSKHFSSTYPFCGVCEYNQLLIHVL